MWKTFLKNLFNLFFISDLAIFTSHRILYPGQTAMHFFYDSYIWARGFLPWLPLTDFHLSHCLELSPIMKKMIISLGEQRWCSGEGTCLPPMWPWLSPGLCVRCGLSLLLVLVFAPRGLLRDISNSISTHQWTKSYLVDDSHLFVFVFYI